MNILWMKKEAGIIEIRPNINSSITINIQNNPPRGLIDILEKKYLNNDSILMRIYNQDFRLLCIA